MSRFRSAFRTVSAAACVAVLSAACAAGQHAATADEKPTLDGTQGGVGKIQLEGVAFHSPSGQSYKPGSSVPLMVYIVNNAQSDDKLVKVTSSGFSGGWGVVPTASANGTPSSSAQTIGAGSAVAFGLQNLSGGASSPKSLVLSGLSKPLFPGSSLQVTFTFANAGDATLTVPVQLSSAPNGQTLPAPSGSAAE